MRFWQGWGVCPGVTETVSYNTRLFPTSIVASSSNGTALNFGLSYYANGNVNVVTNNRDTGRNATYTFDSLNRVITGKSSATSGGDCWGQAIPSGGYDRYGNLLTVNSSP